MDRLPAELITQVAFELPFSLDALALAHTCRNTYHGLSASNKLFWYKRRLQFPTKPNIGQYKAGAEAKGSIATELTEVFDEAKDYRHLVVLALKREPEPDVKKPILRCQVCCINRAYKVWGDFNKALCPACFEVVAMDRKTVAFLKDSKVDLKKIRCQQKRRGLNVRHCYWVQDLEREIAAMYPGKTLAKLIVENGQAQVDKKNAKIKYRDDHTERLIATATERWASDEPHLALYREFFDDGDEKTGHGTNSYRTSIETYIAREARRITDRMTIPSNCIAKQDAWFVKQIDTLILPKEFPTIGSLFGLAHPMASLMSDYHYSRIQASGKLQNVPNHDHRVLHHYHANTDINGICKICHENPAATWDDCQYMPWRKLIEHYATKHRHEYTTKDTAGQWFWFAEDVDGRTPLKCGAQRDRCLPRFNDNAHGPLDIPENEL